MKYQVSFVSEINGYSSESIDWKFDEEADAKAFYDDYDLKCEFETEVMVGGRRNNKDKEFVLYFGRYDEENEVFEVFESKSVTLADIDD